MSRGYWVATALYCAAIFWLSSQPEPPRPDVHVPGLDKVAHFVMFGGLATVIATGMRRSGREYAARTLILVPALAAFAYGVTDEIHQLFVPQRTFSLGDMAANGLGALTASLLLAGLARARPWSVRARDPGETA